MICYHTTTFERLLSIVKNGLVPNSPPTWFKNPVLYIMLCKEPWERLHSDRLNVVLEVSDPTIKERFFIDTEGLRWNLVIKPEYLKIHSSNQFRSHSQIGEKDD